MNWVKNHCENKNEILGIEFMLDILGYWACPTEKGYEIRKK